MRKKKLTSFIHNSIKIFLFIFLIFIVNCVSTRKKINEKIEIKSYKVRVINKSYDKISLRYESFDKSMIFRFIEKEQIYDFEMNGNLTVQYTTSNITDAKVLRINQNTFIYVNKKEIIIDDLIKEKELINQKQ